DALLEDLGPEEFLINEVIEIEIENGIAIVTRYDLPSP
ncbi:toxin-antitoxin system, toxin component, PIN family protein, partial [Mesorhizobium sp. M4B.F.Ca.ET.203.01.1.1]